MRSLLSLAVLAALAVSPVAQAQPTDAQKTRVATPAGVTTRTGAGTLDSPVSLMSGFEFDASEDETSITLKTSYDVSGKKPGVGDYFSLSAKASLDKEEGAATFGSFAGLGKGSALDFKYTHSELKGAGAPTPSDRPELQRICGIVFDRYVQANGAAPDPAKVDCGAQIRISDDSVKAVAPEEYDRFISLFFKPNASVRLWGFTGALGTQEFKYRNPATFAELETTKTPWSLGGYFAYERLSTRTLFILRAEHKRLYEEGDEETRCPNPGSTDGCVTARFAGPARKNRDIASLEVRRLFDNMGVSLTASYDVGDDEFAVDLPVYLVRDGAGGFNGGVRATWTSEQDDVRVGVFMNKAFSVFGDF